MNKICVYTPMLVFIFFSIAFTNEQAKDELSKKIVYAITYEKYSEAQEHIEKYIEEYPNDRMGYMNLGLVYYNQGKLDSALKQYLKAKEIAKRTGDTVPGIYLHLGQCYLDLKKYNEAIEIYQEYLSIDDSNVHVQSDLAKAYELTDNVDSALRIYKKLSKMDDEHFKKLGEEGIRRLKK